MAKSLRQQVLDLCDLHGAALHTHEGSHFIVDSKGFHDTRTWITNNHYLIAYFDNSVNDAYRDLLYYMKEGFVDRGDACDDDSCETCEAFGRSE